MCARTPLEDINEDDEHFLPGVAVALIAVGLLVLPRRQPAAISSVEGKIGGAKRQFVISGSIAHVGSISYQAYPREKIGETI